MKQPFSLDMPILEITSNKLGSFQWTAGDAVEGVQIFGGIGSGKTTGSGRTLALKYLSAGFGGLVLTVKPDEKDMWVGYARLTGRLNDLIIVEPDGAHSFNFLDYESAQAGEGNAITENIVQVLKTVIRAGEEQAHGRSDDTFWESALDQLMFNTIDLCKMAYGKIDAMTIFNVAQNIPTKDTIKDFIEFRRSINAIRVDTNDDSDNFPLSVYEQEKKKLSSFYEAYKYAFLKERRSNQKWADSQSEEEQNKFRADPAYKKQKARAARPETRLLDFIDDFIRTYSIMSDKTRSIVDFSFSGFMFRLVRDPVYSLFVSKASTFTPEDSISGKVIILNLPVKDYHKIGRDCQILFKYIWQRAMEKRKIKEDTPLVFLWADESQNFLHEHDPDFQATARSSRISTVYISQNLPNYHANMGGAKSDFKVKSFLGTLNTKIFHANADIETNRYASDLIGDMAFEDTSRSTEFGQVVSFSNTKNVRFDKAVRPEEFMRLKTGGNKNNDVVEALIHKQGRPIKEDRNHMIIPFRQDYIPHT